MGQVGTDWRADHIHLFLLLFCYTGHLVDDDHHALVECSCAYYPYITYLIARTIEKMGWPAVFYIYGAICVVWIWDVHVKLDMIIK